MRRGHGVVIFSLAATLAACFGGCECQRQASQAGPGPIDAENLADVVPGVKPPEITFPAELRPADTEVAAFIDEALSICQKGDYDGFRQLFGTHYEPKTQAEFKGIWQQVASIEILRIRSAPPANPQFYIVESKARLRAKDRRGREEIDLPVLLYKEAERWRLGPVPKEIRDRLRSATQPAATQEAGEN